MSCETPTLAHVKSSREGWNASGPEIGKLSTPSASFGSGNWPAAMRADREPSAPSAFAFTDGAPARAFASAASNVSGPACAGWPPINAARQPSALAVRLWMIPIVPFPESDFIRRRTRRVARQIVCKDTRVFEVRSESREVRARAQSIRPAAPR